MRGGIEAMERLLDFLRMYSEEIAIGITCGIVGSFIGMAIAWLLGIL